MRAFNHGRARALRKRRSSTLLVRIARDLDELLWHPDSRFGDVLAFTVVAATAIYLLARMAWSWTHGGS